MYERKRVPPLTTALFVRRMALHGCVALALILISLLVGMLGFHHFSDRNSWVFAFLDAAMLLSGMGPVEAEKLSAGGQIFAGIYALYSGLAFIAVMGIMLTPVAHRVMHRFHWESDA